MDENITTVKMRILELVKSQGFKVSKFFDEIGDSYENYKGRSLYSSPSVDILVKIRTKIENANLDWILTGKGEMLVKNDGCCAFSEKFLEKISSSFEKLNEGQLSIIGQNGEVIKINADIVRQNAELIRQHAEAMKIIQKLSEKLL